MKIILKSYKIYLALTLALLSFSCNTGEPTTFYLVRHAEKVESDTMQNQDNDPALTAEGKQRAQKLKKILSEEKVTAIYSTPYQRNINTVTPLADSFKIPIGNYEWHNWKPTIDEAKEKHYGEVIVISGHGDNLLPMIEYLKGEKPQDSLGKHEYDKIFKVECFQDHTKVSVIQY